MLKKGTQAPEFDLVDQDGKRHTLKSLLAKGPLILYFYPADFTPGCTREACTFRDLQNDLVRARLRVVGVSPQDAESHKKFAAKHNLNFPLLADPAWREMFKKQWTNPLSPKAWHRDLDEPKIIDCPDRRIERSAVVLHPEALIRLELDERIPRAAFDLHGERFVVHVEDERERAAHAVAGHKQGGKRELRIGAHEEFVQAALAAGAV